MIPLEMFPASVSLARTLNSHPEPLAQRDRPWIFAARVAGYLQILMLLARHPGMMAEHLLAVCISNNLRKEGLREVGFRQLNDAEVWPG